MWYIFTIIEHSKSTARHQEEISQDEIERCLKQTQQLANKENKTFHAQFVPRTVVFTINPKRR